MKLCSTSYYMLICSLPPLPSRFQVDRMPITRERLQNRVRMLERGDAEEIGRMFEIMEWSRQFEEADDAAVVRRYTELMRGVSHELVREVLTRVLDVRMITAALRRRRRNLGPPTIGVGRWLDHIRRHFHQPDFGLVHAFPRIAECERLFEQGDMLNLYRALLDAAWSYLKRRADDYYFSFEAVVLYVARWEIIRQWQDLQAERGRPILETLVTEALGEHANIRP
jgi:hypothetical protein